MDDDAGLRALLARVLAGRGFQVACEETCAAAVCRLEEQRFQLVLLDVGLPDGSGLDVLRTANGTLGGTAVLVMSGDLSQEHGALQAGARAFLPKPDLLPALERALATRTPPSPR